MRTAHSSRRARRCAAVLSSFTIAASTALAPAASAVAASPLPPVYLVPTTAYPTIQSAIAAAPASGATILVAAGTYAEDIDFLGKPVYVQGALPVGSSSIVGTGAKSVVTFQAFEKATSVLENFAIHGGTGNLVVVGAPALCGGGICCVDAAPTIRSCIVSGNSATYGGGLFSYRTTDNDPAGNSMPDPQVLDSTFDDNDGFLSGGGVFVGAPNPSGGIALNAALFQRCVIDGNRSASGGGFAASWEVAPVLERCLVRDNIASAGGGVFVGNMARFFATECVVGGNSGDFGAGVHCVQAWEPTFLHCTVDANAATTNGGGFYLENDYRPAKIHDCLVSANSAAEGGGMFLLDSLPEILWCSVVDNLLVGLPGMPSGMTGGIRDTHSTVWTSGTATMVVQHSILWGNAGNAPSGFLWRKQLNADSTWEPHIVVGSSDVQNLNASAPWTVPAGPANFAVGPRFDTGYVCTYAPNASYFLKPTSVCIDYSGIAAGSTVVSGRSTSITGSADASNADIGFHYPPSGCP